MTWFWIDDGFYTHPKVMAIPAAHRLRVVGLWTLCGNWSAHQLTDGHVPAALPGEYRAKKGDADLLVGCRVRLGGAGLWEVHPDGGWVFHDWADWQRTKEEIEARRAARAAAGRLGGKASGTSRRAGKTTPTPGSKHEASASRLLRPDGSDGGSNDEASASQLVRESFDNGEANTNPSPARRGPGPEGAPARPAPEGPPDPPPGPGPAAAGAVASPAVSGLPSGLPDPEPAAWATDRPDVRLTGEIVTVLGALMPDRAWEQLDHAAVDGLADRLADHGWTRAALAAALEQRRDTLAAARGPGLAMTVLRDLARTQAPATSPGCPHRCTQGWLDADTDRPRACPHCRPGTHRRAAGQRAQTYTHGPRSPGTDNSRET